MIEAAAKHVLNHFARVRGSIGRSEFDVGPDLGARMEARGSPRTHDSAHGEVGAKPQVTGGPDY